MKLATDHTAISSPRASFLLAVGTHPHKGVEEGHSGRDLLTRSWRNTAPHRSFLQWCRCFSHRLMGTARTFF
jgi:hypothetical protein